MVDGLLTLIPVAKVGHIGLYRDPDTHLPVEYYCKLPFDIEERMIIICDPMLATGGSASDAITMMKKRGCTNIRLKSFIR
jgi:uracil phosphoribosyltransferase